MTTAEDDLHSPARDYMPRACEVGTVGWDSEEEHVDFGTTDDDGFSLVRVQLYAGRTIGSPIKPGIAEGRKILCGLNTLNGFRIPPKGTRVYVLFPAGMEDAPGAGVIVAAVEKSASKDALAKDRVVVDYGDTTHVVFRGKSVSIQSVDNEFVSVGTPRSGGTSGVTIQAKDGTGLVAQVGTLGLFVAQDGDAKAVLQFTPTQVQCFVKGGGYWHVDADGFFATGNSTWLAGGNVYLGQTPSAATAVMVGPAAPSLTIFGSP